MKIFTTSTKYSNNNKYKILNSVYHNQPLNYNSIQKGKVKDNHNIFLDLYISNKCGRECKDKDKYKYKYYY